MATTSLTFGCGGYLKKAKYLRFINSKCRTYSQQNVLKKVKNYTSTIILPKTDYPARHKAAQRVEVDKQIHKHADFEGLYCWQRENLEGPDYVLHDGPPYANGDPHMGHAVNKILKDITIRNQVIRGRRVHYVPGWDCHGLPIELKALNADKNNPKVQITKSSMGAIQLREMARKFAVETAFSQREAFRSWGVMADWDNQCYYTNDKVFVKNQLRQFYNMYEKGYIYRDMKPVYWSPSSGSALAEAELEYDPLHKSTQVYLELPLTKVPEHLRTLAPNASFSAVIWTTTPWSLVGNQAICYSEGLRYSAVKSDSRPGGNFLIIASSLLQEFNKILGSDFTEVFSFEGKVLSEAFYNHPLKNNINLPFLQGDHVSADKGTGLVHTAPAHGPEDFLVALKNNMKVECFVDEEGRISQFGQGLDGLLALSDGQREVVSRLGSRVLHSGSFLHPYPLDWRTKQPIIVRASNQWFIDTHKLLKKAMDALKDVTILPVSSSHQYRMNLSNQIQNRPYWCISRQRVWGVPIPVVFDGDRPLITRELVEKICNSMDQQGVNSWWNNPVDEKIISKSFLKENNTSMERLAKGKDIMDIWLDSGLTWSAVLENQRADLYLEGLDQCTGWFQSSLLTSIALTGRAPYKNLFVHGFTVDSKGRKMSKSIGNVVDPCLIIEGGKNQQKNPPHGIDTLRWWVASHGAQHSQVAISDNILAESGSDLSRIRILMKFLLGALNDLDQATVKNTQQFGYVDSYMLHQLRDFQNQLNTHYETMQYNKVCANILKFTANHVSGFYCYIIKDRLYCQSKDSVHRKNCQVVMNHILVCLCQALGPIVPHFVEEIWMHYPLNDGTPFFKTVFEQPKEIWSRPFVDMLMDTVLDIKKELNKQCAGIESLECVARIQATPELYDKLHVMQGSERSEVGELCEVLQVSEVVLMEAEPHEEEWVVSVEKVNKLQCGRCRKYTAEIEEEPCERCRVVIMEMNNKL